MFSDLTENSQNKISLGNVKAHPSINSPNDGGFNSEENLRWLVKKFLNKPFIVGDNDSDINQSFSKSSGAGNGDYIRGGMFNIDGYTFKINSTGNLSFDSENYGTVLFNTQNIQRFVHELTNQGTNSEIEFNLTKLLFEDYNPKNFDESTYVDLITNLELAYTNHLCIGYVWNRYTNSYFDELTINSQTVKYKDSTIPILDIDLGENFTVDDIPSNLPVGMSVGTNFAIYTTGSNYIDIFYGLYLNQDFIWNTTTNNYSDEIKISFTDIFSIPFTYGKYLTDSRTYPTTHFINTDMFENKPLESIDFDNCKLHTFPQNLYNFESMYDANGDRYPLDTTDFVLSKTTFPDITNLTSSLFDTYTTSYLLDNFIPLGNPNNIKNVNNDLTYYCIKNIPDNLKKQYLDEYENTIYIPVAFMTSEGSLCPNGFILSRDSTSNTYPVEGYVHFVKRLYCVNNGLDSTNEEVVNSITIQQLCSWISGDVNFNYLYNTFLTKPISMYIHLSYCSLMDNVVYAYDNDGLITTTDSLMTKGYGAGTYLEGLPGIVDSDDSFYSIQPYNQTQYVYDSSTQQFNEIINEVDIFYHKDLSSDNRKLNKSIINTPFATSSSIKFSFYNSVNTDKTNDNYSLQFEDPINFLRYCSVDSSYSSLEENQGIIASCTFYKITFDGTTCSMTNILESLSESPSTPGVVNYLLIDTFLLPCRSLQPCQNGYVLTNSLAANLSTHTTLSINGTGQSNSLVNGFCLRWYESGWLLNIPFIATTNKDSLDYLVGAIFDEPDKYGGLTISFSLPTNLPEKFLLLYNLNISSSNTIGAYDIETSFRNVDTLSKSVKRMRESAIPFNRLYGENYISLEDKIKEVCEDTLDILNIEQNIQDLEEDVSDISTDVTSIKTNGLFRYRPTVLIGVGDDPPVQSDTQTITITSISANSYIDVQINILNAYNPYIYDIIPRQYSSDSGAYIGAYPYNENIYIYFYKDVIPNSGIYTIHAFIYNRGETAIDSSNPSTLLIDLVGTQPLSLPEGTPSNPISSLYWDTTQHPIYAAGINSVHNGKYFALGDNIVDYQGTTADPKYQEDDTLILGYIQAVERRYNVACTNYGNAGHTILQDLSSLLALDYTDVDIVTIGYGANDAIMDEDLGTRTDTGTTTFAGGLNNLIRKIMSDNPECRLLVLSPIQRDLINNFGSFTPNTNGKTLEDFVEMCKDVAGLNGIPCIDLFHNSGIGVATYSTTLGDGVHPLNIGYKRMWQIIKPTLDGLIQGEFSYA